MTLQSSASQTTFQRADTGDIELFIDCYEIGKQWDRIYAELELENQATRDEDFPPRGPMQNQVEAPGLLSKIVSGRFTVLSGIV